MSKKQEAGAFWELNIVTVTRQVLHLPSGLRRTPLLTWNLSRYLLAVYTVGTERSLALRLFSLYRFVLQCTLHASHSRISPHSSPCYGPLVLSPPNYFISFKSVILCSCRLRMRKYVSAALVPAWNGWNCWRLCRTAWWLDKAFKWTVTERTNGFNGHI